MKNFRFLTMLIVVAIVMAACTTAAPPTSTPTTQAATATVAATAVATIPAGSLVQKNHLLICTDFPYPPQEYYDDQGNAQGSDVDLGNEIGKRLGLQVQFVNSVFDTIIAAVTGGKCDIAISAMTITAERQKQVSMISYFNAGQAFVSLKGNPNNIKTSLDLCGKAVAAESGTFEADYLQGVNDFANAGLTQACTKAGKDAPTVVVTQKDSDALQQLQAGKVVAYATDSPVADYYVLQHSDQFEIVGEEVNTAMEGIAVPCGQADCTNASLSSVGQAVKTALQSMIQDGTYDTILKKWNLQDAAVK